MHQILKSLLSLDNVSDFLIRIAFQSSDSVEIDIWGFVIRSSLNVKSQGTKKVEVLSRGSDHSKKLRCETLHIHPV